jgi:hypothetical protein
MISESCVEGDDHCAFRWSSVLSMRIPLAVLPLAALAALALAPPAGAAGGASCPNVDVARGDATSSLPAGTYRLAPGAGLGCAEAAAAVDSYLYEPKTFGGYSLRAADGAIAVTRGARSAATTRCNLFTVVHSDTEVGFPQGTYQRLNFFPSGTTLTCSQTFTFLRDYLLDGDVHGYKVGRLTGALATSSGCRFVKNGSSGATGFTVWCDGKSGTRGPCVAAGNKFADNCGGHY